MDWPGLSEHVRTGPTMGQERVLLAWVPSAANHGAKLSSVNNVSGNYS